ncbi:MAG TPA: Ku protein [Gemmatimonadales bacterium]|nr:Ku protein [Gemmatimonadales bacterium]
MAPRAIWSGVVSFGMVNIPVKLFSATHPKDISFNLLHATCGTRIEQKRWCPTDEVEVPWTEVVRGYQYAKGRYVMLTDEDFERLPLASKHTVALSAFVPADEIDPVFHEKSYYLAPDARSAKAYALLLKALGDERLVAIGTITLRKKEQLCALRPHSGTLTLATLYYPDEVELEREVDVGESKLSGREVEMAHALIDLLRKPFEPETYHDHYREALAALIDAKLEGKEELVTAPPSEPKVIDLADALARSVAAARAGRRSGPSSTRRKRAPAAPRRRRVRTSAEKAG